MDCVKTVGGSSLQNVEDLIEVVGESYADEIHCEHRNLCIKVVQSIARKININPQQFQGRSLDQRTVQVFTNFADFERTMRLYLDKTQIRDMIFEAEDMIRREINPEIVEVLLQLMTELTMEFPAQLLALGSSRIHSMISDAKDMILNGITPEIVGILLQLRVEFSAQLENAGFKIDDPISFVEPEARLPFAVNVPNGIHIFQSILEEKPVPEIMGKISEVLGALTYDFVSSKGGNLSLLGAFFLCHYNFESGSFGPFGCIMKAFIASITDTPIGEWQWLGSDGSELITQQEFLDFILSMEQDQISSQDPFLPISTAVVMQFSRRRPKMPDDLPILCDILEKNTDVLKNTFLPMWAATIEMTSRLQFPGNHLESKSCDTYRFESDQFFTDKLRELGMKGKKATFSAQSHSSTVSFSLSTVFINPGFQVILHSSMPYWRIIFPFFLHVPRCIECFARDTQNARLGYVFGTAQNEIVAFSRGLEVQKIARTKREIISIQSMGLKPSKCAFIAKLVPDPYLEKLRLPFRC
ncbi:MAG: hypothetical protein LBQ23_02990 [Puniceicoccales bacterium]|nr:hypothetical protein [Puniceicoccales bacterium]